MPVSNDLLRRDVRYLGDMLGDVITASEGSDSLALVETIRTLLERRMIMTSRPNAMRRIIDQSLAQIPRKLLPSIETNSARMLLELVVQGSYFTVLPYSAVAMAYRQGRVSIAPIQDLSITWTLVTSREQSLSLAGHKLRDKLAEICRNQVQSGQWPGARCLP